MGGLITVVVMLFVFGFSIALTVAKTPLQLFAWGIAISIGLMFVAVGIVFAGCAFSANNGHL